MITEIDVSVIPYSDNYENIVDISSFDSESQKKLNPYVNGLPESVQKELADRYAEIFSILLEYRDNFNRVTFWAVHDEQSWRNYMPIKGRIDYPMLFDRNYRAKSAFDAVVNIAKTQRIKQFERLVNNKIKKG